MCIIVMGLYRPLCLRPGGRRKPMYIIVMALMGLYRTFGLRPQDGTNPCTSLSWVMGLYRPFGLRPRDDTNP